jgi:hypothetical protein
MVKKDLNKLTFEELEKAIEEKKAQLKSAQNIPVKDTPYIIGAKYMIRTVTMIYTGKLIKVFDKEIVLTNCAWIPETERWAQSCKNGDFKEIEPYPEEAEVNVNREVILDSFIVSWELPNKQK